MNSLAYKPRDAEKDRAKEDEDRSTAGPRRIGPRRLGQRHTSVLLLSSLIVAGAFLLEVLPGGRVGVSGLRSYPLPHTCLVRVLFDGRCPSCGLTRSFIHLAHGRWERSLAVHRVGWLVAIGLLVQFPYRAAALAGENPLPLGRTLPQVFGWTLLAVVAGNWLLGFAALDYPI